MRRFALPLLFAACLPQVGPLVDAGGEGGGAPSAGGGTGGGTFDGGTGGGSGGGAAGGDPGCPGFAGCVTFTDHTGASDARVVGFANGNDTYSPRCMRVQQGQTVTFMGSFSNHPLLPSCGPGTNLPSQSSGNTLQVTLTVPGVYGYFCDQHGSSSGSGMAGAIEVVR